MKTALIIADQPGWCFARRAVAIQRYAPDDWDVRIEYFGGRLNTEICYESADVVFLLAPHIAKQVRQIFDTAGIRVPLVVSHNSGVGRNGYNLDGILAAADFVVVNNYAAYLHGRYGTRQYNACNISNGVDLTTFRATVPWRERPNRALWIGSTAKADDPDDVKGYQTILSPLQRILEPRLGISTDFRTAFPGAALSDVEMNDWYNGGRYLVCTSKSEGTPNIGLEGAACGCAVITTAVGNMPELIVDGRNGKIVHRRDTGSFLDAFEFTPGEQFEAMVEQMQTTIQVWDWSRRAPWFYALFDAILKYGAENVKPFSYLNTPPAAVGV